MQKIVAKSITYFICIDKAFGEGERVKRQEQRKMKYLSFSVENLYEIYDSHNIIFLQIATRDDLSQPIHEIYAPFSPFKATVVVLKPFMVNPFPWVTCQGPA